MENILNWLARIDWEKVLTIAVAISTIIGTIVGIFKGSSRRDKQKEMKERWDKVIENLSGDSEPKRQAACNEF